MNSNDASQNIEEVGMQNYSDEDEDLMLHEDDITEEYDIGEAPEEEDEDMMVDGIDEQQVAQREADPADHLYQRHEEPVYCIAIHPSNPNMLASGGGDELALLWEAESGRIVHELTGHTDTVIGVAFNHDGTLLASAGFDGVAKIWLVDSGVCCQTLAGPSEELEWIQWHAKGNVVVAGCADGTAWMWLASTGDCMHVFAGHESNVTCGSFTGNGRNLVTGSSDETLRLWNPKTGACAHVFRGSGEFHEGPLSCIAVHPMVRRL